MLLERLRPYDNIIWDWNGTLLSDVEAVVEANLRVLSKHYFKAPTLVEHRATFGFPIQGFYERLGIDLATIPFETLAHEFSLEYHELVKECFLFEGTEKLLCELVGSGKILAILSAAEERYLEKIVRKSGVRDFFSYVYGLSDTYGKSKIHRGRDLLLDSGFDPKTTILIGDTDHDLHVGRELGIDVLLIADGHQDFYRLREIHYNVLASRFITEC